MSKFKPETLGGLCTRSANTDYELPFTPGIEGQTRQSKDNFRLLSIGRPIPGGRTIRFTAGPEDQFCQHPV